MQANLFKEPCLRPELPDAELEYYENFLSPAVAWESYHHLLNETPWRQESITVYGKTHPTPRLSCWVGDAGTDYSYSNMTMSPLPWTPSLLELRELVEKPCQHTFNSVLLNWYRDGRDSNGWHSDNEPELGRDPVIASLSFGATRDFKLRHRGNPELRFDLALTHGSLLVMKGTTQQFWEHHLPKRAKADSRINLTFRTIIAE